jgi:hypothetical protein
MLLSFQAVPLYLQGSRLEAEKGQYSTLINKLPAQTLPAARYTFGQVFFILAESTLSCAAIQLSVSAPPHNSNG